jgi:alpha-mannosidase
MRSSFASRLHGAFFVLFSVLTCASAQNAPAIGLSAHAHAVLDRLGAIEKGISDSGWRYHEGDMPHGEDVALDESTWTVAPQGTFNLPVESVWFRRTLVLPATLAGYPIDGARLSFKVGAFAEGGISSIVYVDGNRVALGEDLEATVLTTDAKPGQTFHIAVKMLHSAGEKQIRPFLYLLQLSPARPNPIDFRVEVMSAEKVLPSLTIDSTKLMQQEALLEKAVDSLDVKALDTGDQAKFDVSLHNSQQTLEPLMPVLRALTISLVGNAHMDTAWLWPWTETVDTVKRTFSTALQLMSEYPNYKYSQSYALYYEWMKEKYPDIFHQIQARVKQGRWEVVGGMWVEPDLNMPDGESLVRQLLIGKRLLQKTTGVDVNVGWNPDSFGYTWQLPQIYKKSGIDYFVTQKMNWNETNKLPLKTFWWESPDGSRVLTYFPDDYNKDPAPLRLADDLVVARKFSPGSETMMHLYGIGDHGGGPTRSVLDMADHWMQTDKVFPTTEYSTAGAFFADLAPHVTVPPGTPDWNYQLMAKGDLTLPPAAGDKINIPVWKDELYLENHRGVLTTQARHKQNMREEEERMLNAEKVASIAWLGHSTYPAEPLNEAWKKVLMDQFHDTMSGSGASMVYVDTQRDYEAVRQTSEEVSHASFETITAHVDTQTRAGAEPLLVFNPLGWKRTDVVTAEIQLSRPAAQGVEVTTPEGHPLLTQPLEADAATGRYRLLVRAEDVPPMGYVVLQAKDGKPDTQTDLRATGTTLENSFMKVVVDPSTGCITHLVLKESGFDSIAPGGCGNELQAFIDIPKKYDAWNVDADALDKLTRIHEVDSVELVEQGPLRASVRISRHWGKSKFVQYVQLYAGSPRVDVQNDFDWQETHVMLKAAFPLAASSTQATYEIPYGTIQRPTTRDNSVEKARFEVAALRWADLGDGQHGFSLMNQSKYAYDAVGNVLRLSLLRSPMYPAPDADKGEQHFLFSLYPHAGTWQQAMTERRGYELNYGLMVMQPSIHTGTLPAMHSFLTVDGDGVVVTAMKKAEDSNGIVLRMYEWQGKTSTIRITVPGAPKSVEEIGMMEGDAGTPQTLHGNVITTTAKPYEIKTLRIDYGDGDNSIWTK